jgi:hypothetical protein
MRQNGAHRLGADRANLLRQRRRNGYGGKDDGTNCSRYVPVNAHQ